MTSNDHIWRPPLTNLALPSDEIHVWRAFLDQPQEIIEQLNGVLSADERERAGKFYFERDRRRFIVARGVLKTLLAHYLRCKPIDVHFHYGERGKPSLAECNLPLYFNLSHSEELALLAFTCKYEIGVDVEYVRPLEDALGIAKHYFSVRERECLAVLAPDEMYRTFFTYWTRKEACLKECGQGLALLTEELDVLQYRGRVVLSSPNEEAQSEPLSWSIEDLTPAPDYLGALAVQAELVPIRQFF